MKEIKLTQDKVALVDDEDYDKVNRYKWYAQKIKYGFMAAKGDRIGKKVKITRMHRFIMGVTDRNIDIDHINHNCLDNRKSNLRICTRQQNSLNKRTLKSTTSGVKGVFIRKRNKNKPYEAKVMYNYKTVYCKCFSTLEEAKEAYNRESKKHFGEFYYDTTKESNDIKTS